jgi:hypothetical protein
VICAVPLLPRLNVMFAGATLMSKSGGNATEDHVLTKAFASIEPSPVAMSYPGPAL